MNNPDEEKIRQDAMARAEFIGSQKEIMQTMEVDELLNWLENTDDNTIAAIIKLEVTARVEAAQPIVAADFALVCLACKIAYPIGATRCSKCGGELQSR